MPFETPILAAVPAVLNFAVKGTQTSFELQQVPGQTQALFETIASTRLDIINAREQRVALAKEHSADDLAEYDRSVRETEAALTELEKLVEPARIDLEHNDGKIRAKTRLMWVMKDSKSLSATSDRLTLAHQRMSFAIMMLHMKRGRDCRETPSLPVEEIAPPPYINHKRLLKKTADESTRIDIGGVGRSRSMGSVNEDMAYRRPIPRTRTIATPTLSRHDRDFEHFLNQHEQTRSQPPIGRLRPLLASVEALTDKPGPAAQSRQLLFSEEGFSPPVRSQIADPSVSLLNLNRLPMMQPHDLRPRQRPVISPPITPPESPYQTAMDQPTPGSSNLRNTVDNRIRIVSPSSHNYLPTVQEASSIRFELDASEETPPLAITGPPRAPPKNMPSILRVHAPERRGNIVQSSQLSVLPYPRSRESIANLRILPEQGTAPMAVTVPEPTSRLSAGFKSTPHFFAGHQNPVNIRWKSESHECARGVSTKPPEVPGPDQNSTQTLTQGYVYQPYRRT